MTRHPILPHFFNSPASFFSVGIGIEPLVPRPEWAHVLERKMAKKDRDWVHVDAIPAEITGERRELLEMLLNSSTRKTASWSGASPRLWRFVFPDTGGWSVVAEIRQDQLKPSRVAAMLSGEAFASAQYEREVMGILRRLVPTPAAKATGHAS